MHEKHLIDFPYVKVLFCTRSSEPLSFRETRKSDWLGSPLRRYILQSLAMREINLETIRSAPGDDRHILKDHRNPLGALQEEQGSNHWIRMFLSFIVP